MASSVDQQFLDLISRVHIVYTSCLQDVQKTADCVSFHYSNQLTCIFSVAVNFCDEGDVLNDTDMKELRHMN